MEGMSVWVKVIIYHCTQYMQKPVAAKLFANTGLANLLWNSERVFQLDLVIFSQMSWHN